MSMKNKVMVCNVIAVKEEKAVDPELLFIEIMKHSPTIDDLNKMLPNVNREYINKVLSALKEVKLEE